MIPLLNGAGELMTNDMRKDEVLNVSASVSKVSLVFRNTRHSRPDENLRPEGRHTLMRDATEQIGSP